MWHQPIGIDRIAGKAATNMVIHAAETDLSGGEAHGFLQGSIMVALCLMAQKPVEKRLWKLWRAIHAAALPVHMGGNGARRAGR